MKLVMADLPEKRSLPIFAPGFVKHSHSRKRTVYIIMTQCVGTAEPIEKLKPRGDYLWLLGVFDGVDVMEGVGVIDGVNVVDGV